MASSSSAGAAFQLVPLHGEALGAEVIGLDLETVDLSDQGLIAALRQAFLDYQVLVFRGQVNLTPARHDAFSRRFGTPYPHIIDQHRLPDFPGIHVVSNEVVDGKNLGRDGVITEGGKVYPWHSDLSYVAAPPAGSFLHILKCPPPEADGNRTHFANMYSAYETLEPQLQARVRGLKAVHCYSALIKKNTDGQAFGLTERQNKAATDVVHPLVRTHPETLRDCLFIGEQFTKCVVGLDPEESRELIRALNAHATRPEHVYTHHWRPGDLVLWDNRCTLHKATACSHPRRLHRATVTSPPPEIPYLLDRSTTE